MDWLTPEKRHNIMKSIHSNNTSIEIMLRRKLWKCGVRYRIHKKIMGCKPDITIKKYKLAIFVDGDFWHGRNYTDDMFKSNQEYWNNKIRRNIERDLEQTITLRDNGWRVLRFWESEIKQDIELCCSIIMQELNQLKNNRQKNVNKMT